MKNKVIYYTILILISISLIFTYLYFYIPYSDKISMNEDKHTDSSKFNNRLSKCVLGKKTKIIFEDNSFFYIFPISINNKNKKEFIELAQPGDSIYKDPFSKQLKLIKDNKEVFLFDLLLY